MNENATNRDETKTTQRYWHDLKPSDVILFATGWYEVLDAYPVAPNTVLVKLAFDHHRVQTYRVRVNAGSKATCRA